MADASDEGGVTKALSPRVSSASYDATASREAANNGPPPPPAIEYDVERVEKVYRKLDLRIIPGMLHSFRYQNPGSPFSFVRSAAAMGQVKSSFADRKKPR